MLDFQIKTKPVSVSSRSHFGCTVKERRAFAYTKSNSKSKRHHSAQNAAWLTGDLCKVPCRKHCSEMLIRISTWDRDKSMDMYIWPRYTPLAITHLISHDVNMIWNKVYNYRCFFLWAFLYIDKENGGDGVGGLYWKANEMWLIHEIPAQRPGHQWKTACTVKYQTAWYVLFFFSLSVLVDTPLVCSLASAPVNLTPPYGSKR